jgi:hypothetical protein
MTEETKPNLRPTLFWDVDYEAIQWNKNYRFIIERVLERGTFEEWQTIKQYYGLERIKEAALQARWLNKKVWHFCSLYFEEPLENFRCSELTDEQRAMWPA